MLVIASIMLGASWNIDGDMQHNCWYIAWIYVGETKQRQSETSPLILPPKPKNPSKKAILDKAKTSTTV